MKTTQSTNVLLAGVLGFAAGMLFAPKSGPDTREELRIRAEEAKHRVRRNASDELKRKADSVTQDALDHAESKAEVVKDKARSAKRAYDEA
jgi:gas vesicle protein